MTAVVTSPMALMYIFPLLTFFTLVSSDAFDLLMQEYKDSGAKLDGFELAFTKRKSRGLKATRLIRKGEFFIRIPTQLGYNCLKGSCAIPLGKEFEKHENGLHSRLSTWIDTLPSFDEVWTTFPHFHSDLIQDFKYIFTRDDIRTMRVVRGLNNHTAHARSIFASRGFDLGAASVDFETRTTRPPGQEMLGLGVIDMLNHHPMPNCGYFIKDHVFHVVAARNIYPGEEIFISYGKHDNKAFVLTWGFSQAANPKQVSLMMSREKCSTLTNSIAQHRFDPRAKLFVALANEMCLPHLSSRKRDL